MLVANLILLSLILIGIVYLIVRDDSNMKVSPPNSDGQKLLEQQKQLKTEVKELKENVEFLKLWLDQDYKKMKMDIQSVNCSPKQENNPTTNRQHLFLNDRYKEIFELHEKGFSADEIAKELGKGSGEIAFILQLAEQDGN